MDAAFVQYKVSFWKWRVFATGFTAVNFPSILWQALEPEDLWESMTIDFARQADMRFSKRGRLAAEVRRREVARPQKAQTAVAATLDVRAGHLRAS